MIVRQSNYLDWPDILRMGKLFTSMSDVSKFAEYDETGLLSWLASIASNESIKIFVAEDDRKIVGMSAGIIFPVFWAPKTFLGQELFWWVDKDARTSPAGKMLKLELEKWAVSKGASGFYMVCLHDDRSESIGKLYQRSGYHPTEHTYLKVL